MKGAVITAYKLPVSADIICLIRVGVMQQA